jgi:hypothetical protein
MGSMKKIPLVISFLLFLAISSPAFANALITTPYVSTTTCADITTTLSYGNYDTTTDGQVTVLQYFLHAQQYLSVAATGYFGPLTFQAVESFQKSHGLEIDGIVGPQTAAGIKQADCQNTAPVSTAAPTIAAITPTSGATGTVVTITGTGFTAQNNIVHFASGGMGAIASATGSTLTFTIPTAIGPYCAAGQACPLYMQLINAGSYDLSVENSNGTSNTMSFTIIGNSTTIPI